MSKKTKDAVKSIKTDKTIAARIPYTRVYEDGMIEQASSDKNAPNRFSVVYHISDVPAAVIAKADPRDLKIALAKLLDGFAEDVSYQFYVVNSKTSADEFLDKTLLAKKKDETYNKAVEAYNSIITENAGLGHNNMQKDKYIAFSLRTKYPQDAADRFEEIRVKAEELFAELCGIQITRLTTAERLNQIYSVYNVGGDAFGARAGMDMETFNLSDLSYMKLTTKDLVAPRSMKVEKTHVVLNDKVYAKTFFINNFPVAMSNNLISDLTNVSSTMIYSSFYQPLPTDKGFEIAKAAVADNTVVRYRHDKATLADRKSGNVVKQRELVNKSEGAYFANEALEVLTDSKASDNKIFMCSFLITLFSDNTVDLERDTKLLTVSATKFAFQIKSLDWAQAEGLASNLPLGACMVDVKRVFSVDKLCALNPLDIQASLRQSGVYYGINSINDNLILLNRKNSAAPNGLITGVRNAGKSYQVKREIVNNLITTNDLVFLIANPHEYKQYDKFVQRFDGATITEGNFNPFRIVDDYGVVDDGTSLKEEFLTALCSSVLNFRQTMNDTDAMDRAEKLLAEIKSFSKQNIQQYSDAIAFIHAHATEYPLMDSTFNSREYSPLLKQYTDGDKLHGKRLNYFKVPDAISLLIVLERIWSIMIGYKKKNVSTWIYIDSIDEVLSNPEGARYLRHLLKLSNILQNPITIVVQRSAMFSDGENGYALKTLFPEIGYYKLLNEGPIERKMYADALNIQPSLLPYVTNAGIGKGLIISSSTTVPFTDNLKEIATNYETIHRIYK